MRADSLQKRVAAGKPLIAPGISSAPGGEEGRRESLERVLPVAVVHPCAFAGPLVG